MSAAQVCTGCGRPLATGGHLTTAQAAVLGFLSAYIATAACAPTHQTIADHFGYRSLATVSEHLESLERKGYIRRVHNATQGIEIVAHVVRANPKPYSVELADAQPARLKAVHT